MRPSPPPRRAHLALLAATLFLFALSYVALNQEVGSDPKFTLLVSQALVDHGTIRLDAYQNDELLGRPFADYVNSKEIVLRNGHFYYYFPAGPSILSLPAVAAARWLGLDMRTTHNFELQRLLAALFPPAIFLVLYSLGCAYLPGRASFLLALIFVLGSSLISTLGIALWSLNFSTLAISLSLLLLTQIAPGREPKFQPSHVRASATRSVLLGLLLFIAFFARASAVAFILPALLYLLWRDWRQALRAGLTAALLLALFLAWNRLEFGTWLPDYYAVARLQVERASPLVGILGNLVSPSRGLFVFMPYLLVPLVLALLTPRRLLRQPLAWLCLAWLVAQLWLVARAASWWGGTSFGPRLLTDALPAVYWLTLILLAPLFGADMPPGRGRSFAWATFLLLGGLAVFVHSYQGLFNQATARWNAYIRPVPPAGESGWGDLFNPRYAQPLATNPMLCRIEADRLANYLPQDTWLITYTLGETITQQADQAVPLNPPQFSRQPPPTPAPPPNPQPIPAGPYRAYLPAITRPGNQAILLGWAEPTDNLRWSQCPTAEILFRPAGLPPNTTHLTLTLSGLTLGPQQVTLALNGTPIGTLAWEEHLSTQQLTFDAGLLRPGTLNRLAFSFPDAHAPPMTTRPGMLRPAFDQRPLGLSFAGLRLEAAAPGREP